MSDPDDRRRCRERNLLDLAVRLVQGELRAAHLGDDAAIEAPVGAAPLDHLSANQAPAEELLDDALAKGETGAREPEHEIERHENGREEEETPAEHEHIVVSSPLLRSKSAVNQVTVYSGPEPPSGGVRRPPFAVIAPHWTQFDGVTSTSTLPSGSSRPTSYTCAGHMFVQSSASSRGTRRCTRMWLGMSSRVLFPLRKTDE